VLGNGRKPLVPDRGREPVGHQHVVVIPCQLDLVVSRPVILDPQHVGDQVEYCIPDLHILIPERVRRNNLRVVVVEDRVGRGRVPGLDHAMVPGNHNERDAGRVELFERFEHCRVGFCLRLHRIEEISGVDEDVGFLVDDRIHCRKEIIVHLLFAQVHPGFRIEPVERSEPEMGVSDVDEFHLRNCLVGFYRDIRGEGAWGENETIR